MTFLLSWKDIDLMSKINFKDLKNFKDATAETNPLTREDDVPPSPTALTARTRISVDVDTKTLKKINSITTQRQLASDSVIPRASVVRDLLLEAVDRHYQAGENK